MSKNLIRLIAWDFKIVNRNEVFSMATFLLIVYIGFFLLLRNADIAGRWVGFLIFNDPIVTSYLFIGIIMLRERDQNVTVVYHILPLPMGLYLTSKVFVFTVISLVFSVLLAVAGIYILGVQIDYFLFCVGVVLSSILFILLGMFIVFYSKSFSSFILNSLPILLLYNLPYLEVFGLSKSPLWIGFPFHAGIKIIDESLKKTPEQVNEPQFIFILIALLWVLALCYFTHRKLKGGLSL